MLKVEDAHAQSRAAANTPIAPRIQPGERLPEPETAFRSRKGVRWHTDPAAPGYAVATIECDKRDRFLAFGIRDGRVEWIGQPGNHMGLCRTLDGQPTAARKGCSAMGGYDPS